MRDLRPTKNPVRAFPEQVGREEKRRLRMMQNLHTPIWLGFSVMGLIGWGVVVPSLAGLALGAWLDSAHPGNHSWTLSFFSVGLLLGCFNAGYWLKKEMNEIHREQIDPHKQDNAKAP